MSKISVMSKTIYHCQNHLNLNDMCVHYIKKTMFDISGYLNDLLCDTYVCQLYINYSKTAMNIINLSYIKKYDGILIMYG
jgi:hypothetical protein